MKAKSISSNLPLVSFVIPTHNRADVLRDCLESVVNQTYANFEVVVVNDNSKDTTEEILKEYSGKYNSFKYYNSTCTGGNAARNWGIEMANGEYIAFMDDDDICELDRITEQIEIILSNNKKYDFLISGFYIADSNGKKIKKVDYKKPLNSVGFPQRWLIKKEVLLKAEKFDIEQPALQDVEFFWRLKANARIFFDPKPVVSIRNSKISITKDKSKMIIGISRLLKLHGEKMSSYEKNIWLIQLCKNLALINSWSEYRDHLMKVKIRINPFLSILLYLTLIFKDIRILRLHSRIQSNSERVLIKLFKRNPPYNYLF